MPISCQILHFLKDLLNRDAKGVLICMCFFLWGVAWCLSWWEVQEWFSFVNLPWIAKPPFSFVADAVRVNWGRCFLCVLAHFSLTLCDPVCCSPPGPSVHGILQARILEWVAMPFSKDLPNSGIKPESLTSPPLAGRFFTSRATWEDALGSPLTAAVGVVDGEGEWSLGLPLCFLSLDEPEPVRQAGKLSCRGAVCREAGSQGPGWLGY